MCEQPSSWMAEEKFRLKMKGEEDLEEATFRAVPRDSRRAAGLDSRLIKPGRKALGEQEQNKQPPR